jgi:glycosyltransferase involved in cell wall biosynthesis
MRCVILNTYDVQGGAARAAYRLHKGLLRLGQDSAMVTRFKQSEDPTVHQAQLAADPAQARYLEQLALIQRHLIDRNRTEVSNTFFSLPWPGYDLALHPKVQGADVLNLHWVAGLLSPQSIVRLHALGKPLVWTLHDQRAFTGGCHFSAGCRRYESSCSDCPQLRDNSLRLTEKLLAETLRSLPARELTVATPSRWLAECARRSAVFRNSRVVPLPNSVETDVFKPLEKAAARQKLGLSPQGFYFLFGADSCFEKRKGFNELLAAISLCLRNRSFKQKTDAGRVQFLCFGHLSKQQVLPGLKIEGLGHFTSDAALCEVYAAADVFLLPSLEDNLPNTVLEAMSCGTPVIAHEIGGVPEMVEHDQTGFLVPVNQPAQFARAMLWAAEHAGRVQEWRNNGLRQIQSRFSLAVQARSYLDLFEELTANQPAASPNRGAGSPGIIPWLADPLLVDQTEFMEPKVTPLDVLWSSADGPDYKPSWRREEKFLSPEHEQIWEKTKHLPGWQDPADSQKLYEMALHSGGIILEIGVFGGRSAAVELLGANVPARGWTAQLYGLDVDPSFLERSRPTLQKTGIAKQCLLYHGNLSQFHRDLPIVPTMVFVDGDHEYAGVRADLMCLKEFVAPNTPILCHDYSGIEGVRRAVDEMLQTPWYQMAGLFAGSILLRATEKCTGKVVGLSPGAFEQARKGLLANYLKASGKVSCTGLHTPVASLLCTARELLDRGPTNRTVSGQGPWPYSSEPCPDLPTTMPDGQPWPKISLITPSFNHGQFIEQTILSVLNQKYPNLEYIVMDGGSTDKTSEILKKYHAQFAYCASEKDRGQCHAINKGFARATGEICSWLNSDDLLAPGALPAIALAFRTSEADMVAGICQLHQDGEFIGQHLTSCPDGPLPLHQLLDLEGCWLKGQFFHQPEVFFKRALWEKAGGQLKESLYYSLDYELWLRFAQAGAQLKVIGRPVAQFRVHEEQKTFSVAEFRPELESVRDDFMRRQQLSPPANERSRSEKDLLRVVLFNDIGFLHGAGIAQQRLAMALRLAGHEVIPIAFARPNPLNLPQDEKSEQRILAAMRKAKPDVVLLGNLHAAGLGERLVAKVVSEFPTISVLHDLWLLTGRCAYNGACNKFLTGCDETCPTAREYPALAPDKIGPAWQEKTRLLAECQGWTLAGNSRWMNQKIADRLAQLPKAADRHAPPIALVRFGLPLDIFKPRDKSLCREILNLPQDKFLILSSCSHQAEERKGMSHLVEAMQTLGLPDAAVVCLGHKNKAASLTLENLIDVGYVHEPLHLALLYSAADLFVSPALEEAFGQVFIEAAACGTPSVGYPVGGVPEALRQGITGHLAATVVPEALAQAIQALYSNPALRQQLSVCGRIFIENEFSFAASYHKLFQALRSALTGRQIDLVPKIAPRMVIEEPRPVEYIEDLLQKKTPALAGPSECSSSTPSAQPGQPNPLWSAGASRGNVANRNAKFEASALEYFQQQLNGYRKSKVPWVLKPGAWLARLNRNAMSKKAAAESDL